jgi:hypothetical protein
MTGKPFANTGGLAIVITYRRNPWRRAVRDPAVLPGEQSND